MTLTLCDGESRMEDCFELRSSKHESGEIPSTRTTFAGKVPLKLYPVFSAHPIHVVAAEAVLELSSFTGSALGDPKLTRSFRPSLLAHARDLRNLVGVRDFANARAVDELRKWEIANACPTIEYFLEGDGGKRPFNVPKVRLTYFLYQNATQPFLEGIMRMPIIFTIFASSINVIYGKNIDNYLANQIA